jgi:TonB-dependent starch-binding outer membrane protein SusC
MKKLIYPLKKLVLLGLWLGGCQIAVAQHVASLAPLQSDTHALQQGQKKALSQVLSDLESAYHVSFVYEIDVIDNKFVDLPYDTQSKLPETLNQLLKPYGLKHKKIGKNIYTIAPEKGSRPVQRKSEARLDQSSAVPSAAGSNYSAGSEAAETLLAQSIRGRVSSDKGEALPGVSVVVKGTTIGTATDSEGRYALNLSDEATTLVFSFIGYATEEVAINNRTVIDVTLLPDVKALSEVVVVGYGTQKRSDVTGALSSVSEKDFREQPVTRVDQALQGRVPGVQVTNAGGAPGGDVRIRIRGANSLSGDNDPLYVVDGFVGADFTTINPQDIASIEVLKDASATAIYGSRGANGVIIITTKGGRKGEMRVDVGARVYSSELIKRYNTLDAAEFAETVNARDLALTAPGQTYTPRFTDAQIQAFRANGGTDWQDEIFRTAPGQEYQLGLSGGNEKTSYLISANFLDQKGIINNSGFKRYSFRTNIASQISQKFSVRLNLTGTRKENLNTGGTGQRSGALSQALAWAPTTPVRDANGNYTLFDPTSSLFANPVAITNESEYLAQNTNANLVSGFRYEFIPGLSFDVQLGLNYLNSQSKSFQGVPATRGLSYAGRSSGENITWQNINTLNYKKTFNSVHSLDFTAVFETQQFTGTGFNVNVTNLTYPSQKYDNLALSASSNINSGYQRWSLLSLLGRVNYSFKDRYLFSATVRRDGSSKFQGDNKFSVFPSVALGWRVSEEGFMKDFAAISNLKIRGSWGLTGSQAIGPYGTMSTYVTNLDDAGVVFNGNNKSITAGILMGNPGNATLKWETTEQVNVGAELGLFNERVSLVVDYFVKNTRDLLMLRGLPDYVGSYSIYSNIGKIQNKGWEFGLNVVPIQKGDFTWSSSINLSLLENRVISLDGQRDTIPLNENVLITGQPMNSFYGYRYLGTWKPDQADEALRYNLRPGDARYEDVNNDGRFDEKDYQIIGNGMPKTSIGWNNTFTYKGLSLNIFLQGLYGFDKFNYTYAYGMVGSTDAKEIILSDIRNRYIPGVNETSDIPAFSGAGSNAFVQTSRFVEKGDFLRLKNVSLAYTLPKSFLKNIADIRVFVSATNLLTFTNYRGIDPESNSSAVSGLTWQNFGTDVQQGLDYGSYPNSKTYTAGINFSF